jgi:hypothetical protein
MLVTFADLSQPVLRLEFSGGAIFMCSTGRGKLAPNNLFLTSLVKHFSFPK